MFTELHVNTSMEQEFSQTMSGLVKKLIGKKKITGTSKESLKNQTYNLMKQLARKIVYKQTDQSENGETKTELTQKTEFSMHESIYTLIRKRPKKKKKDCIKSQVLKQNTRSLHYSNVCEMIKNNTTKLIRNKLTLHENSKKIVKKKTYNREKSLAGNIQSMEKLLSCWKKDFKKKAIVADLKWSMKSTFRSFVLQNEIMERHIKPIAIVPPLPLPMWAKALDEPPQTVILRKTPSLNSFFGSRLLRSKMVMRRRRNGSRKPKSSCMIPAESLARALSTNQKWNKGPRQVPVSTFQATRIHYRFLLAKYGKSRLMGRQRVYPNSIKSNVHSNFSVINLLHEVEEAISQNKYSKETDKIIKNFKDELNKDLLYNEPINRKYHKCHTGNSNNPGTRKKGKWTKQSSGISLSEIVEKLGGNDSDDSYNDTESEREIKSETFMETGQLQYLDRNNPDMNSLVDKDPNGELFNNEIPINDTSNKLKTDGEDIEVTKVSQNRKIVFKERRTVKKKKALMKEPKQENISEEERLNAILQELQKQVKVSELPTPLVLTKDDSLTELNFQKEPCTYLGMHGSSITIDSDSQLSHTESTAQKECSLVEPSEKESKQSLSSQSEPTPQIKKIKPPKSQHSSTKLYTFRIDYECIKNKPLSICNIITALDRVNKLLQNIPIQYDKNTGRPYIVYDPKAIVNVIKDVNVKHEYKMVVKKYNKKVKNGSESDKSLSEDNELKTSKSETTVKHEEKGLQEVGNQLLKCILNAMEPSNLDGCISCFKDKEEYNKYSQTFDLENPNGNFICTRSLEDMTDSRPIGQLTHLTEPLTLPRENIETIRYEKTYFEQTVKTALAHNITGIYHQAIIYMEKHEYSSVIQPTDSQKVESRDMHEINQKRRKVKNSINIYNTSSSYAELKEKFMEQFKQRKNLPVELNKKFGSHLTKENSNQTQTNISQKYYQQYNKTRKLLLTKYEYKRNMQKECTEKFNSKPCLKTDSSQSLNSNEVNTETNSCNNHSLSNTIKKPGSTSHTAHNPTMLNTTKSQIFDEKRYKTRKNVEVIQSVTAADIQSKNDLTKGQNRTNFNPLITFSSMDQLITNKNDLLNNKKNNCEGLGGFSLNKSIMNSMLRSVSINTIPNTYPIRKDITKQVLYFQTTYPFIEDINDIYKKRSSQEFFKPSKHDIFSKFIYYKENSMLKTYKNDVNQQVMDSVKTIKDELNKNINNICQIVNIDNQLLIKFLKICLKQNKIDFEDNKKFSILEKEIEELRSLMEEHFGKKANININPLRSSLRNQIGPGVRGHQKIMVFDDLKIKQSVLKKEPNEEEININQILNDNSPYAITKYPITDNLKQDIYKKRTSQEFFKPSQHNICSKLIYHKENNILKTYTKEINQQIIHSLNTIKNEFNKNISNICKIVNIDTHLLIKLLKICLKRNEPDIERDKKMSTFKKEMEELRSLMEACLGKKTNPLRLIQRKQEELNAIRYQKMMALENNTKFKQSILKNEPNMEEISKNPKLSNNRLCSEILRFLNFLILIFSLISFFSK